MEAKKLHNCFFWQFGKKNYLVKKMIIKTPAPPPQKKEKQEEEKKKTWYSKKYPNKVFFFLPQVAYEMNNKDNETRIYPCNK